MRPWLVISMSDPSQVGDARRQAMALGEAAGLNTDERGRLAIVVTELASNLVRHAQEGQVWLRAIGERGDRAAVEVIAIDVGPGMTNVARCLEDGYSTRGTAGTGLGAAKRLARDFEIYSQPQIGTAALARVGAGAAPAHARDAGHGFAVGAVNLPYPGEDVTGDGWAVRIKEPHLAVLLVDGLGHGPLAAAAADEAVRLFCEGPLPTPGDYLTRAHGALRKTRGAAAAVALVNREAGQVSFAGVGNISAAVIASEAPIQRMVSHNGTLGHLVRKIQEFTYGWGRDSLLLMHSDGLGSRWDLAQYPGLAARDPLLIAARLCRDHQRGRDDVTVLAAREA